MQETKCTQLNSLKIDDLYFVVYEKMRVNSEGGGVAIAAKKELNPVLVSEGDNDVETITIDIHLTKITISCTSAYGPQKKESDDMKTKFWKHLDDITDTGWDEGKGFYLQGDLNAWLGDDIVAGDPRKRNENGKLFHFLQRHPQLSVVNALPICQGVITRRRELVTGKIQESVLDFTVVCSRVLPYLTEMVIDVDNKYITINYTTQKKAKTNAINSDHRTTFCKMNLMYMPFKFPKREIFNLKNVQCQSIFKKSTDESQNLRACLKRMQPFLERSERWKEALD